MEFLKLHNADHGGYMAQMKIGTEVGHAGHKIKRTGGFTFAVDGKPVKGRTLQEVKAALDKTTKAADKPAKAKEAKPAKAKKEGSGPASNVCICGCGAAITTKRKGIMFKQGHDMRLKGILAKISRGELTESAIPAVAKPFVDQLKHKIKS